MRATGGNVCTGVALVILMSSMTLQAAQYASRTVDFNLANQTMTTGLFDQLFGNHRWVTNHANSGIVSNQFRIVIPGQNIKGIMMVADIAQNREKWVETKFRFDKNFQWGANNDIKLPCGLGGGSAITGGSTDVTSGWSCRLIKNTNNKLSLYVYHANRASKYGDKWDTDVYAQRDVWYTVRMYVKSNSANTGDGVCKLSINGQQKINKSNITWARDAHQVGTIHVECFRGGAGSPPSATTYVWVDYIKWGDGTGPDDTTPPPPPEPTYPSIHSVSDEQIGNEAAKLLDGNTADEGRWSAETFPQWAIVDYGSSLDFKAANVFTMESRAYQYTIEASDSPDGGWKTIVDRTGNTSTAQPIHDDFSSTVSARYVRLTVTGADGYSGSWVSITELEMVEGTVEPVETGRSGRSSGCPQLLQVSTGQAGILHYSLNRPARISLSLYNGHGQRVGRHSGVSSTGSNRIELNTFALPPGRYIARIAVAPLDRSIRSNGHAVSLVPVTLY